MSEAAPSWPVVIELKHPFDLGSERITALTFRRGRLGDLRGLRVDGIPPVDDLLLIASRLCGKPLLVIEKLEDDDASEVLAQALGFFARCLKDGKTP
jgi:hypothetical protein